MKGRIFDIQRSCLHDGPGLRTTVFFAGCNLRCLWCHNPESLEINGRLQFLKIKCIGCGKCFDVCTANVHNIADNGAHIINRERCDLCGKCVDVCWAGALSITSREINSDDVIETVMRDKVFYKDNGGMTLSGGEPLLQPGFAGDLLKKAKANDIHTAVDTAGNVNYENFKQVMDYTDLFLYDLKCMDEKTHIHVTGASNKLLLENLKTLTAYGADILIRIPVICTINDSEKNMKDTAAFLAGLEQAVNVELLPYHKLGGGKYESLGISFNMPDIEVPDKEYLKELALFFLNRRINVVNG